MSSTDMKLGDKTTVRAGTDQEKLRAAQITQIYNQSSVGGFAAAIGAVVLAGALWHAEPHFSLIVWTLFYLAHYAVHRYLVVRFRRIQPTGSATFFWGRMHQMVTLTGGLAWGYAAIFLFPEHFLHLQIFMIIFIGGVVAGGVALYSPTNEYLQNIMVALLPLAGQFVYHGGTYNITVGCLLLMYGITMALSGRSIHATYAELLTLRFERYSLIEELKEEIIWRKNVEGDLVKARDELELRVEQRTAEIAKVNEDLRSENEERRRIENALRVSENSYRSLAENIPGAVYRFRPSDNAVKFFNTHLEQISGFSDHELSSSLHNPVESLVVPEDKDFAHSVISNAILNNKPFEISYRIMTRSGEIRWCTNYGSCGTDKDGETSYVDGVIFDITDRKMSEELIRESEEKYRLLVDNAREAIFVVQDGFFKFFNPRTSEVLGYSPDELTDESLENMVHQDDKETASDLYAQAMEDKILSGIRSFRMVRKDGSTLWAQINSVLITWNARPATLNFLTDITDIKRAEDINARTERLRVVGELASGVAHNFNNLLQVIMAGVDLALIEMESGSVYKIKNYLEQIRDSSRFGSETVKRLQSFAKTRTDVMPLEMKQFDLSQLVRQVSDIGEPWWKTNLEKDGIQIRVKLDLEDGCFILGKESELFEVMINLIKNAAEAMPHGGEIGIKTGIMGDHVILEISDTGIGILSENMKRLFEPFWSTKGAAGTGLGLAASHGIVNGHGGAITAESKLGKGTTFAIKLPLDRASPEKPSSCSPTVPDLNLKILVVDDTGPLLAFLHDLLKSYNQSV